MNKIYRQDAIMLELVSRLTDEALYFIVNELPISSGFYEFEEAWIEKYPRKSPFKNGTLLVGQKPVKIKVTEEDD